MTLDCPKCSARYNIQDSLIPATGARVKCKKCATVITIPAPVMELAPQDLELIPPAEPAAPSPRAPSRSFDSPAPSPKAPAPRSTPPASPAPPPLEEPAPFEHGFGEKSEHEPATAEESGIEVDRPFPFRDARQLCALFPRCPTSASLSPLPGMSFPSCRSGETQETPRRNPGDAQAKPSRSPGHYT